MKIQCNQLRGVEEGGASSIEYVLLLSLVSMGCLVSIGTIAESASFKFQLASNAFDGTIGPVDRNGPRGGGTRSDNRIANDPPGQPIPVPPPEPPEDS